MQFSSFLFATLGLAVAGVWAKDDIPEDGATCLRLCRDNPVPCQAGWVSTQMGAEGKDVCFCPNRL